MNDVYERMVDELRSCARRGLPLPHRPEGPVLWEVTGDGFAALLIAVEYDAAVREVEREIAVKRVRRTLADVAA